MVPLYTKFPVTNIMKPNSSISMAPILVFSQGVELGCVQVIIKATIQITTVLETSTIDLLI